MSMLPAHSRRNGDSDDERTADDTGAEAERPVTGGPGGQAGQADPSAAGRNPERPRYAFAYAPADDEPEDDEPEDDEPEDVEPDGGPPDGGPPDGGPPDGEPDDSDSRDRYPGNGDRAGTYVPGRTVVAGDVVDDDPADEPADQLPPTVPVPVVAPPTVEVPAPGANSQGIAGDGTAVPAPRYATGRAPGPADAAGLEEPLLAEAAALRARWQRAQSDFVDDPRAAVADAAALVAQTAQAMMEALEQRQRLLRQEWERDKQRERGRGNGQGNGPVAGDPGDTERLRLAMRSYRALFNQMCAR